MSASKPNLPLVRGQLPTGTGRYFPSVEFFSLRTYKIKIIYYIPFNRKVNRLKLSLCATVPLNDENI